MVSADLYYTAAVLFGVAGVVNLYQYVLICKLQDRADTAEDALGNANKVADQLQRDLRAAKVEIEQQTNRALRVEMLYGTNPLTKPAVVEKHIIGKRTPQYICGLGTQLVGEQAHDQPRRLIQAQPVDHVYEAVMAGHTGMMAEAMKQHELDVALKRQADLRTNMAEAKRQAATQMDYPGKFVGDAPEPLFSRNSEEFRKYYEGTFEPVAPPMVYPYDRANDCTPVDHSPASSFTAQDSAPSDYSCPATPDTSSPSTFD